MKNRARFDFSKKGNLWCIEIVDAEKVNIVARRQFGILTKSE